MAAATAMCFCGGGGVSSCGTGMEAGTVGCSSKLYRLTFCLEKSSITQGILVVTSDIFSVSKLWMMGGPACPLSILVCYSLCNTSSNLQENMFLLIKEHGLPSVKSHVGIPCAKFRSASRLNFPGKMKPSIKHSLQFDASDPKQLCKTARITSIQAEPIPPTRPCCCCFKYFLEK